MDDGVPELAAMSAAWPFFGKSHEPSIHAVVGRELQEERLEAR